MNRDYVEREVREAADRVRHTYRGDEPIDWFISDVVIECVTAGIMAALTKEVRLPPVDLGGEGRAG